MNVVIYPPPPKKKKKKKKSLHCISTVAAQLIFMNKIFHVSEGFITIFQILFLKGFNAGINYIFKKDLLIQNLLHRNEIMFYNYP